MNRDDFQNKNLKDLRTIAKAYGMKRVDQFHKEELIDKLLELQELSEKGQNNATLIDDKLQSNETIDEINPVQYDDNSVEDNYQTPDQNSSVEDEFQPQSDNQCEYDDYSDNGDNFEPVEEDSYYNAKMGSGGLNTSSQANPAASTAQAILAKLKAEKAGMTVEQMQNKQIQEKKQVQEKRFRKEQEFRERKKERRQQQQAEKESNEEKIESSIEPQIEDFDFDGLIEGSGVLEIKDNEGFGYLRSSDYNYQSSSDDIYVSAAQIKQYGLKTGDTVLGNIRPPKDNNEKFFSLTSITSVNGCSPDVIRDRVPFEDLTPLFPEEKFDLDNGPRANTSTRIVDLFAPIGKGQRGLIVAQPKTGKTMLLKDIANVILYNHPEVYMMVLLIDERPEEVTDMERSVNAEVIASTFDEGAQHHVKIADIVLEKAKRMVECGHDVVILLDSITRLARAYNTVAPASGKVLSGGVDANALQKPKRFFGAARNIEGGGSLTIIATALTDTGSKMDDVIFEEFKGTGNMELQLDRRLSNKRIFPAVDLIASSTRRDDLLFNKDYNKIQRIQLMRKMFAARNPEDNMSTITSILDDARSNEEFLSNFAKYSSYVNSK